MDVEIQGLQTKTRDKGFQMLVNKKIYPLHAPASLFYFMLFTLGKNEKLKIYL